LEAAASPGQLHRVTEPATLGAQVIGAKATPITSIVNMAALSAAAAPTGLAGGRTTVTSVPAAAARSSPSSESPPPPSSKEPAGTGSSSETNSAAPPPGRSSGEFTGYVHKLKKAWMMKSFNGDGGAEVTGTPDAAASNGSDAADSRINGGAGGGSGTNSSATSPQLTRATPSPAGSTKSTGSGKGFPSAVRSAPVAAADIAPLRLNNGHHNGASPVSDRKEDDEDEDDNDDDLSSGDQEDAKPAPPKPQRKKSAAKGKPGPKPKGRPAGTGKAKAGSGGGSSTAKRTTTKGSESDNFSDSEKESDSSKASSRQSDMGGGKKRGRKPVKAGAKAKGDESGEPRQKKLKAELSGAAVSTAGSAVKSGGDPFARPSVSQLKKTGDSFLQDASCFEVAPKLNKCRECRWSQAQRQKQSLANIFCRFYAFRRLRYTKNGQIAQAGFCDPRQDAQAEDLKLWLPSQELSPPDMDKETAKLILRHLSSQFYTIYRSVFLPSLLYTNSCRNRFFPHQLRYLYSAVHGNGLVTVFCVFL
jgi:lysine-specific demethylase 3